MADINRKAMEMKSEAEELLDKAVKKIDQLRSKSTELPWPSEVLLF